MENILTQSPLILADQSVYHILQSLRTLWTDRIFVAITEFGDTFVVMTLACAVLILLLARRCYRTAGFWFLAVGGGQLGVQWLKLAVHRTRPMAIYQGASAFSFPSSHAAMSMILLGFLAILIDKRVSGAWRLGMVAGVMLIGFSRLYLGAHWLSDVLGGYLFGLGWVILLGLIYFKKPAEAIPIRSLGLVVTLVLMTAGGWHVHRQHKADMSFYTPRRVVQTAAPAISDAGKWCHSTADHLDLWTAKILDNRLMSQVPTPFYD